MKKMIKCNKLMIALVIIVSLFAHINTSAQGLQKAAETLNTFSPSFNSKSEIIEWSEKKLGYSVMDTISLNAGTVDVFALYWNYASGDARQFIFVFTHDKNTPGDSWTLFCTRNTNTAKVNAEVNEEGKEIVFKSKSGKVLMTLPFEGLAMKYYE